MAPSEPASAVVMDGHRKGALRASTAASVVSSVHGLQRAKRVIGLLFLAWLAVNLNPIPAPRAHRLRIARKPPLQPSSRHGCCCDACSARCLVHAAGGAQRECCMSYAGVSCAVPSRAAGGPWRTE